MRNVLKNYSACSQNKDKVRNEKKLISSAISLYFSDV